MLGDFLLNSMDCKQPDYPELSPEEERKMEEEQAKFYGFSSPEEMYAFEVDGDVMTVDEFVKACKLGLYIDYDGIGSYSNDKTSYPKGDEFRVSPSDIMSGKIKTEYKYVHWFNR